MYSSYGKYNSRHFLTHNFKICWFFQSTNHTPCDENCFGVEFRERRSHRGIRTTTFYIACYVTITLLDNEGNLRLFWFLKMAVLVIYILKSSFILYCIQTRREDYFLSDHLLELSHFQKAIISKLL